MLQKIYFWGPFPKDWLENKSMADFFADFIP